MSPESEQLVRESWERLRPTSHVLVRSFYVRLFEQNPSLQALFSSVDIEDQATKFAAMLSEIVRVIGQPALLIDEVAEAGRWHRGYGVQARDYEDVGAALLWALERALGEEFTPEVRDAWREAYDLSAAVMRRSAARDLASV